MVNNDNYKIVENPINEIQANIFIAELESTGIKSQLKYKDKSSFNIASGFENPIELLVVESDYLKAKEILRKYFQSEIYQLKCPKCSSDNIEKENFGRTFFKVMFRAFYPKKYWAKQGYNCLNCKHNWTQA